MLHAPQCVLYSGGAAGAEQFFGALAEEWGVEEVNYSFDGHQMERKRGVRVLAVSSDDGERAATMAEQMREGALKFGYGLSLKSARQWGLFISTSRGKTSIGIEEPALFSEPGLFLVRPDGTLYYGAVQTMPFARPSFKDLLMAIDFAIEKDYPARGEYTGAV